MSLFFALSSVLLQDAPSDDDIRHDALSYSIELQVNPSAKENDGYLSGRVDYLFRAQEDLDAVHLDSVIGPFWHPVFQQGGKQLKASWEGDKVTVQLAQPVAAGKEFKFSALLGPGIPPHGFRFGKNRHNQPTAWTDHFSIRARGWLPCEDNPADRAIFKTIVRYPKGTRAVASGVPQNGEEWSRLQKDGWMFSERETVAEIPPYLYAIGVGPWDEVIEGGEARLRPHLVWTRDKPKARRGLLHHAAWMKTMEEVFGPYSYGKYLVVQVPTRWGGMENAGNTWLMERIFDAPGRGIGTMAHELAHQWFGDAVGYAAWKEVWLSEGFASYFGPWLHASTGGPSLDRSLEGMRRRWLISKEGRTLPIRWGGYEHPDSALNTNTYPKGAWVLHMLRGQVGDEDFFAGIKSWYLANRGTAVNTSTLREALEEASGQTLGWFFSQWLDHPGCPELRFKWENDAVIITQIGAPWRFNIRLRWTGSDGEVREKVFTVDQSESRFELEGGPIQSPVVDPLVELLWRKA
mgnify:CR=1 FL=1